jgi:MFS transporter, DHA1 family, inner membrane transport protein
MRRRPNHDIQRLSLHAAIGTLATAVSGVFSAAFLIRVGLTPAQIFLAFSVILALRFLTRPLFLVAAPAIGLRRTLILGVVLTALSCPTLALVSGIGPALVAFIVILVLGHMFYCTCYHVFFSALGDNDRRGSQIGICQALGALAALFGPGIGGVLLTTLGPWAAFGTGFLVLLAAILPILQVAEPQVMRTMPEGAYAAATNAVRLYFADGWIQVSLTTAWSMVMFEALGGRYDSFGGTLSLAGLAGAVGGMALGRLIDKGHTRPTVWINAAIMTGVLILRSAPFGHAAAVVAVAVGTTLLSGLYLPFLDDAGLQRG